MTREQLFEMCFKPKDLEEAKRACGLQGAWMRAHPDDEEMLSIGEGLFMHTTALQRLQDKGIERGMRPDDTAHSEQ